MVFVSAVLAVLVLVGGALLLTGPYDPNPIDPASSFGVETVEVADLAVTVVDSDPALGDPEVWLGLRGPEPAFDTSRFGPDMSFGPGIPAAGDLHDRVIKAVYLGHLDGEPFYVYSEPAPSIGDWFSEIVAGNLSGQIIGTSLDCCMGGDMDHEGGLPGVSAILTGDEPPVVVAKWLGLSPDVSVVAYFMDGEFVGWQTPVGGVSALRLDKAPLEYVIIAFDAQGRELHRYGPHQLSPMVAAIEAIQARGGVRIGLADIWTDDLRDVIAQALEQGPVDPDWFAVPLMYAVPFGEFQVVVVIAAMTGDPHVYATSCHVLDSVDLPGEWRGTCLERTVAGQREVGIFEYPSETG